MKYFLLLLTLFATFFACSRGTESSNIDSHFSISDCNSKFLRTDTLVDEFAECYSIHYMEPENFFKRVCFGILDSILYIRSSDLLRNCPVIIPIYNFRAPESVVYFYGSNCLVNSNIVIWSKKVEKKSGNDGSDGDIIELEIFLAPGHLEIGDSSQILNRGLIIQVNKNIELIEWKERTLMQESDIWSWPF